MPDIQAPWLPEAYLVPGTASCVPQNREGTERVAVSFRVREVLDLEKPSVEGLGHEIGAIRTYWNLTIPVFPVIFYPTRDIRAHPATVSIHEWRSSPGVAAYLGALTPVLRIQARHWYTNISRAR